ncbi:putative quinol monooxygenase [Flavobacterium zepuense]|nr:antibiotic biosynthesis monooxygenase [Flavobacterium zepuense]
MKVKTINNIALLRAPLVGSLLLVGVLLILQTLAFNGNRKQQITRKSDSITANEGQETFQELGFFGEVREDKWSDFVGAVQNNIAHSRKEKGNLSFSLYQPEDGKLKPIWFERFKNKAAYNYHKEQSYFKDAITVIQQSLTGEAKSTTLQVLDEVPAVVSKTTDRPETARHVIVLFDVKPEKRKTFIDVMAGVASRSRSAKGNLEINLYGFADNPNKFVLVEGWQSQADHEAQLKQYHIKRLTAALEGLFVSDPMDTRYIVKDISE